MYFYSKKPPLHPDSRPSGELPRWSSLQLPLLSMSSFNSNFNGYTLMDCTIILFVADWTLFCDFTRKHLPARLVIFVAQLGRKFRLFSLTVQRYEYFQCLPNNNRKMTLKKALFEKTYSEWIQISDFSFIFAWCLPDSSLFRFLYYYNNIKIIYNNK